MDALYFLAMLIGIAALALWSVLPEDGQMARWWWPFDMRETQPVRTEAAEDAGRRGTTGPRPVVRRTATRQGGGGRTDEPRAAPAIPARGGAVAWRDRRQVTPLGATSPSGRRAP